MGNGICCSWRPAPRPLEDQQDNMEIVVPRPSTFSFKIKDVQDYLAIPSIARIDKNIDKVFLKQSEAQITFQKYGFVPEGYVISHGNITPAVIIFPSWETRSIVKMGIYWDQLTFPKLKQAVNAISNVICINNAHQYNVHSSNIDFNERIDSVESLKNSGNLTWIGASKRGQIKINPAHTLVIDVIFKKSQKFQIPKDAQDIAQQLTGSPELYALPNALLRRASSSEAVVPGPGDQRRSMTEKSSRTNNRKFSTMYEAKDVQEKGIFNNKSQQRRTSIRNQDKSKTTVELITESSNLSKRPSFTRRTSLMLKYENIKEHVQTEPEDLLITQMRLDPVSKRYIQQLGSLSYLSSVVQALSHIKSLSQYLLESDWKETLEMNWYEPGDPTMTNEYFKMLWQLAIPSSESVSIEKFHWTLSGFDRSFNSTNTMMDAAVCLDLILKSIHSELCIMARPQKLGRHQTIRIAEQVAQSPEETWRYHLDYQDSPIAKLFHGMMKTTYHCHTCKNIMDKYEIFQYITLIPKVRNGERLTLEQLLKNMSNSKDAVDQYCLSCRDDQESSVIRRLYQLPPVLIIQIQRFSDDISSGKFESFIEYPLEGLNMMEFVAPENVSLNGYYDLAAVICHSGGQYTGNNYTFGKRRDKEWYIFANHPLTAIRTDKVVDKRAYILIYELANQ